MSLPNLVRTLSALLLLFILADGNPANAQQSPRASRGQFALVHRMERSAGSGFTLTVDYAELLSGDAAEASGREDRTRFPGDPATPYIENRTKTLRTLNVPAFAQIYLLQGQQLTLVKPAVLYSLLQGEKSPFGAFRGFPFRCEGPETTCLPVRIIQRGGRVLRIEQEYLR